jgi:SAM-dependent methyltransferase
MTTQLRKEEHNALQNIELQGRVLDLGGDTRSQYQRLFRGTFSIETLNMDSKTRPDVIADLEKPLPLNDASYNGALLINVLEHVFEYRQLLGECARILKPGGIIVVVVPFIFPYHASPSDFHRYTFETLQRALSFAGFSQVEVHALGSGVCAARWTLLQRLLPGPLQFLSLLFGPLAHVFDTMLTALARGTGKKYTPSDYALGYVATARKMR